MTPRSLYLTAVLMALAAQVGLVIVGWRHRHVDGWLRLSTVAAACSAWTILVAAMAVATPEMARALLSIKFLTLGLASVSTFLFVLGQTGRLTRLTPWHVAAFLVLPLGTWTASWRDGAGVFQSVTFARADGVTYLSAITFGPLYQIELAYHYGLVVASLGVLLAFIGRGGPIARGRGIALLLGVLSSVITNLLLINGVASRVYDPMPFGLAAGALLMWSGGLRHTLDLVPVARHAVLDALADGILIVDGQQRIIDINHRMAALLRVGRDTIVGRPLASLAVELPLEAALRAATAAGAASTSAGHTPSETSGLMVDGSAYDLRVVRVPGTTAFVLLLHDVTLRQRLEDDQQRLIGQLQGALGEVKTLSGLLPICSGCKQIRDAEGMWHPMEVFIRTRTDADFSHGMCPACVSKWYPDLAESPSG